MRRWWFGLALLLALAAAGLLSGRWMQRHHSALAQYARESWAAARDGDTEAAGEKLRKLHDSWYAGRGITAVLTDHAALEEIDALLLQLENSRDREFLMENSLRLASMLEALAGSQRLSPENLL